MDRVPAGRDDAAGHLDRGHGGQEHATVLLPTNHHTATGHALDNAELVLAPPEGKPVPAYIEAPQGGQWDYNPTVPTLPPPVTVSGVVTAADQKTPVEADLVFESIAGAASTQGIYVLTAEPGSTRTTSSTRRT